MSQTPRQMIEQNGVPKSFVSCRECEPAFDAAERVIEKLIADNDRLESAIGVRGNILRYVVFALTGGREHGPDIGDEAQRAADEACSKIERLTRDKDLADADLDRALDQSSKYLEQINGLVETVERLTRERDEYRRLYEFRGRVLSRPCTHCGYVPKCVTAAKPMTYTEQETRKIEAERERVELLDERDRLRELLRTIMDRATVYVQKDDDPTRGWTDLGGIYLRGGVALLVEITKDEKAQINAALRKVEGK